MLVTTAAIPAYIVLVADTQRAMANSKPTTTSTAALAAYTACAAPATSRAASFMARRIVWAHSLVGPRVAA